MLKKIVTLFLLLLFVNYSFGQTTIKLKRDGNVYLIPCKISGLDVNLFFDTGNSNWVSLSQVETKKLISAGKLNTCDIIGKTKMSVADGQFVNGAIVLLRMVDIGGVILKEVEIEVADTQHAAAFLIGDNPIKKFKEFTFDFSTELLTIKKQKANSNSLAYSQLLEEYMKKLTPEQKASFEELQENRTEIMNNLRIDVVGTRTVLTDEGDNMILFSMDLTNKSDFDYVYTTQNSTLGKKSLFIEATIFTTEGRTYSNKLGIFDLPSGNTMPLNDQLYVNTRKDHISGMRLRVIDVDVP